MDPCPYTPAEIEQLQQLLEGRRSELFKSVNAIAGDLKYDNPGHFADEQENVAHNFEQGFEVRIREREQKLIAKIEKTLQKISDGKYGICSECDEWINIERLKARPVTEMCIECKQDQELHEKLEI